MIRNGLFILLICLTITVDAQTYMTRNGSISFYSDAPMEKIESHNNQVTSKLDVASGALDFAVLIKAFQFEKQLMYQHFNEDYLESTRYPKANFQGQITNLSSVDFSKAGTYPVTVSGNLYLHGINRKITQKGTLKINGATIKASAQFRITLEDFNIKVPVILKDKIAKTVLVDVSVNFQ